MNLFYISALPKTMSGGPKYSVPRQVNSQSKYDNVYWINVTPWGVDNSNIPCVHEDNCDKIIEKVVEFKTDLVIFEDFYYIEFVKLGKMLRKRHIPYVIVPRGCMTKAAQKTKHLKKLVGNFLIFDKFARKAEAIQYLIEGEKNNSGNRWNKKHVIVPNGAELPLESIEFHEDKFNNELHGVFIARINRAAKGIDVLLDACGVLKDKIIARNLVIDFYGPAHAEELDALLALTRHHGLENNIFFHTQIHGDEKKQVLLSSDFFVLTSRFEGMPMGVLEAMAYGLPCLLTDETNIGGTVANADAGLSSPVGLDGIIKNLNFLLDSDLEDFRRMSRNAIKLSKEFDWDRIAFKCHSQYLELLGKSEKP